ncbi:hypothetical protein [Mycolicibacterium grossiae]|uniref:Uncharacterized protein n=1 Tax=Mycolicibacterium grossiae TaxID=1552759 RepID=A0A1E8Q643_9MYCO|nr:hypothetical protein [Mycolicibacterium grossiae]OFJ54032.1 hypothetical protein BEL07_09205 [Mycolicibacterium grossiae]QEM44214.1 hypothetical protein FZ046_04975 [Mycolicibacterium grossiae]
MTDGFDDNPLDESESLDSDEVRNDDGDEVTDPPEEWIEAKEDETLDERLADEVPDVGDEDDPDSEDDSDDDDSDDEDSDDEEDLSDDALDRLDPSAHGTSRGQIDGTPEDGESFYDVVD